MTNPPIKSELEGIGTLVMKLFLHFSKENLRFFFFLIIDLRTETLTSSTGEGGNDSVMENENDIL